MAKSVRYKVKYRRRRELLTDYRKRLALVKSGLPRFVVRKSGSGIVAQIVEFGLRGDKTVSSAVSKELENYGWKGDLGNISAAYLTGLLLGKKCNVKDEIIMDIGRQHPAKGGRLFAALKGAIDAGLNIRGGKEAFPKPERISGKHISDYCKKAGEKKGTLFSKYAKRGLDPEKLPEHFASVKESIIAGKALSQAR